MIYENIVEGKFVDRPNRFIAHVEIEGTEQVVHVKNTGRCKELLVPGAVVYLEKSDNPARSTAYDLIAVKKGERIVNMDSQTPNKVVAEWLKNGSFFHDLVSLRPETTYGTSRFDFYVETKTEKVFIEVKGVTLEEDGVVRFPDAPSERALKHVEELIKAKEAGYRAILFFVVQMRGVKWFTPNVDTQPEFAEGVKRAAEAGVEIYAYDCRVTPESIVMNKPVPIALSSENLNKFLRKDRLLLIPKPLLKWYDTSRRTLPWREEPTPYHVWVSEIMLQQTRVEAVKPYYHRFMEALPDIVSLAEAKEEVLLKLWEGLGYYNRVRNMQLAAKQVMEQYDGNMPGDYEELLKLKGIGSYTAGAIASIAFGQKVPAVDGNVLRVLARYCMDDALITDVRHKQRVEQELGDTMSQKRPGDFNQAMMELGAMVCVPNGKPHCEECPLQKLCQAHQNHCETDYPKKKSKKERSIEKRTVLIIQDAGKAALRKRPAKGLLAGMYEFPCMEGEYSAEQVLEYLREKGLQPLHIRELEPSKHIFSHKEWHMKGYAIRVDELARKELKNTGKEWIFVEPALTQAEYPIPSAFAAYVPYLNIKQGKECFKRGEEL
ncbi:MAG: DNA/RNA nuclease SfsA [Lachnospiraceae bacterium]|nr:DNA/RNA nuclease SfsA [Lachnospiraceae bacterium]